MQSSRKPRRVFAAPLVLTVAALPACFVSSDPKPAQPVTRDHRAGDTQTADTRDGTRDHTDEPGVIVANPPPPDGGPVATDDPKGPKLPDPKTPDPKDPGTTDQTPATAPTYPRSWTVSLQKDGTCTAFLHVDCKKGQTCNPPPPQPTPCPSGITIDRPINVHAAANSTVCYIDPPESKCPTGATCNPPPPKKVSCP